MRDGIEPGCPSTLILKDFGPKAHYTGMVVGASP